eukprot:m.36362 g.36362  ORF g.36362 m.36362 type:complete len:66 (-) comp12465_c0_seq7:120-317(-)
MSKARFETLEQEELDNMWDQECWVKANYDKYKADKEAAELAKVKGTGKSTSLGMSPLYIRIQQWS